LDNSVIIKRLWAILKPYRGRAFLSLLAMALTAATQPLLGKALELLMDKGFNNKVPFSLWWIPGVLVSIFVLRGIGTFATAYYNNWVLSRVLNDLRGQAFARLLRLPVGRFHDPQREGVEVEQQFSVVHQAAARDVAVADHPVPARVLGGVGADEGQNLRPVTVVPVVAVHDLDLAEVDRLAAEVDVGAREEVEPQLRLRPADVGHRRVAPPVAPLALRVDQVRVAEVPLLGLTTERGERPIGNGDLLHLVADDFEHARLQHDVRVGGVHLRHLLPRLLDVAKQFAFAGPEADAAADELGADRPEHPDVVVLDLSMPDLNGLQAATLIHNQFPETQLILLTMHDSLELKDQLTASGIRACIRKDDLNQLVMAIRNACHLEPKLS